VADQTVFSHPLRVRWGEVDAQGVVFNPNYFVYSDVAALEFFRAAGVASDSDSDMGQSYVVDAHATFRASARFDDLLDLHVFLTRIGRSSYAIRVDITRAGQTLVEVALTYVRAVDGVSMPLSEGFRASLADMETPVQQIVSPVP
jgi:acyl-CoA thioester hydrolase